jgi:hypothetical protein
MARPDDRAAHQVHRIEKGRELGVTGVLARPPAFDGRDARHSTNFCAGVQGFPSSPGYFRYPRHQPS